MENNSHIEEVEGSFTLKKFLIGFLAVAALAAAGGAIFVNRTLNMGLPKYDGVMEIPGLKDEVTIYRDEWGVPHIEAANEQDAAAALGYAHAQERMFQMVLLRGLTGGRMAEIFGDKPFQMEQIPAKTMVEYDHFMRVVGLKHYAETEVKNMPAGQRAYLDAYAAGVNCYLENNKPPVELALLKHRPEPWTAVDVLILGRYVGWQLSANWHVELFQYQALSNFGVERGWELAPRHSHPGPFIIPAEENPFLGRGKKVDPLYMPPGMKPGMLPKNMFKAALELDRFAGLSPFSVMKPYASNNWAVAGSRSASGAPILSNDPHLLHMLPSVFFEAHIKTADGLNAVGVSFPGMPFIALGHNETFAWAATTTRADNQDLFIERANPANPDEYWDPTTNKWRRFDTRVEVIRIKDGGEVKKTVRISRHGPIISDVMPGGGPGAPPVALKWAGHEPGGRGYHAFQRMGRARNAHEFMKTLSITDVPIQNWVFADAEGNIGYFAAGYYPIRPAGCDGTVPVRGDTTDCDWLGYVPMNEVPQMLNPKRGYIVTANNQVIDENEYPHIVSFNYSGYRAKRIEELLNGKEKLTPNDMWRIQVDDMIMDGRRLTPFYLAAWEKLGDKKDKGAAAAVELLRKWDFHGGTNSAATAFFFRAYFETVRLTLEDELPAEMYEYYLKEKSLLLTIDNAVESGRFSFFDNVKTKGRVETRDEILAESLRLAAVFMAGRYGGDPAKWNWGAPHALQLTHPFSDVKPLDIIFKRLAIPVPGSTNSVFAEALAFGGDDFPVNNGPVFRHVMDMSNPAGAKMVIDTGQGGHIRSKHYMDQNPLWLKGEGIPISLDMEKVKREAKGRLTIKPKK